MKKTIIFCASLICFPAFAYDWSVIGNITLVEPTRVPDAVNIQINKAAGLCAAGAWLVWEGQTSDPKANVGAIYSAALAALMGGKSVRLYGTDDCMIEYMHVLQN